MEKLEGIVQRVIFAASEGTFCVFSIEDYQGDRITVAANQVAPHEGDEVELQGVYKEHPRYGLQFQANCIQKLMPHSVDGAIRFLENLAIRGLGAKSIERLVDYFGEDLPEVLKDSPRSLMDAPGIRKSVKEALFNTLEGAGALQDITEFLSSLRISTKWASQLFDLYGSRARDVIEDNPYKLIAVLPDFSFTLADDMALRMGIAKNDPRRIEAGVLSVLAGISDNGHTCLPIEELIEEAVTLLDGFGDEVADMLDELIQNFSVHYEEYEGMQYIYPYVLYAAEIKSVRKTLDLLEAESVATTLTYSERICEQFSVSTGIILGEEQREAISLALTNPISVITGGPGTGKTTIIKALVQGFQQLDLSRILLCAPTGRAAKRLSEATNVEATTIHRLLQPIGVGDYEFLKNEEDPLEADVIIVDEASMLNIQLYHALLDALLPTTVVVLVGDVNQLPPIGAGFVLRDLLDSELIPFVELSHIYRQQHGNEIVSSAYRINQGEMPPLVEGKEFAFVPVTNIEELFSSMENFYEEALTHAEDILDVQIIAPMRRGAVGSNALSKYIQTYHRKKSAIEPISVRIMGQELCVGDKVIQNTNNYELEIFNGEIGIIYAISKTHVFVRFPDKDIPIPLDEAQGLSLAYAITVHKSQGSEYSTVIIPFIRAYHRMLQRNLLYTAVTRAKEKVIILGTEQAIRIAVDTVEGNARHTLFKERLQGVVEE